MIISKLRRSIKKYLNLRNNQYIQKFQDPKIRYNPTNYNAASALQLLDIIKVITDSFTPYKTSRHILGDLFMLPYALLRIMMGIRLTFNAILSLPLDFLSNFFTAKPIQALNSLLLNINALFNTLILSAAIIIKGLAEIFLSPLSLLRMPFRGLVTYKSGWPRFELNHGLNRCLDEGEERLKKPMTPKNINELKIIIKHLNFKTNKAHRDRQNSQLPKFKTIPHIDKEILDKLEDCDLPEQENPLFQGALQALDKACKEESPIAAIKNYFKLFRPEAPPAGPAPGAKLRYAYAQGGYTSKKSSFFTPSKPPSPDKPTAAASISLLNSYPQSNFDNNDSWGSENNSPTPTRLQTFYSPEPTFSYLGFPSSPPDENIERASFLTNTRRKSVSPVNNMSF